MEKLKEKGPPVMIKITGGENICLQGRQNPLALFDGQEQQKKLLRSGQEQIVCRNDLLLFCIFPQYVGLVCLFPGEIFVFPAKMAVGGSGLVDGT